MHRIDAKAFEFYLSALGLEHIKRQFDSHFALSLQPLDYIRFGEWQMTAVGRIRPFSTDRNQPIAAVLMPKCQPA